MSDTVLTRLAETLTAVCPEDFPRPIYVVDRPDSPNWRWSEGMGGFVSGELDLECQTALIDAGLWHGRGFCMALDTAAFTAEGQLTGMFLHEAGHMLLRPEPSEFTRDDLSLCREAGWQPADQSLVEFLHSVCPPTNDFPLPLVGHDAQFIRGLLHLWARWPEYIQPYYLGHSGGHCCLTAVSAYEGRLRPELEAHPTGSIRDLLGTPAPPEFTALFEADVQRIAASGL